MAYLPPFMIVDDDDDDVFIAKRLLSKAGVENKGMVFKEPRLAIRHLEAEIPEEDDLLVPFLIFTDLKMPEMNGFELVIWIRAQPRLKKTRVVMLTTSANREDVKRALVAGADEYIQKFPTPSEFRRLVESAGGSLSPLRCSP